MVDVAVAEGGVSGDAFGGEGRWGEGLELPTEVGSGVVAVSLSLLEHCLSILSSRLTFQLSSYHLPYSIYRRLMPWKWAWRVVWRMHLSWPDVRMWW